MAQRIVRGKAKIRDEQIPYVVPSPGDLPERLDAVLSAIYLVFNEVYPASQGVSLLRVDLTAEAIRLGQFSSCFPIRSRGLLALMLLHESRRQARAFPRKTVKSSCLKDRSRWDYQMISRARHWWSKPFGSRVDLAQLHRSRLPFRQFMPRPAPPPRRTGIRLSCFTPHCSASILRRSSTQLGRRGRDAGRSGSGAGPDRCDSQTAGTWWTITVPTRPERSCAGASGKMSDAKNSYERAISLARQEPERRFLTRRLSEIHSSSAISCAKCLGNGFLARFCRLLSIGEFLV